MQQEGQRWPVYAHCEICAVTPGEEMEQATRALAALLHAGETVLAAASALTKGRHALVACTDARVLSLSADEKGVGEVLFALPVERVQRTMSTIWYGSGNVTVFFEGGQQDFCNMSSHASTPMCRVIDARQVQRRAQLGMDAVPDVDAQGAQQLQQWPVYAGCQVYAVAMQPGEVQATRALTALLHADETVLAAASALTRGQRSLLVCTQERILSLSTREEEAGQVLFALPMRSAKRALGTVWYGSGNITVFFEGGQEHFCSMPVNAFTPICRLITAQYERAQA